VSRPAPIKGFVGQFVVFRNRNFVLIETAGEQDADGAYRNINVSIGTIHLETIRRLSQFVTTSQVETPRATQLERRRLSWAAAKPRLWAEAGAI